MSGNSDDTGWIRASEEYQARLRRAGDRVDRLILLSESPMFSFWSDIKRELALAADEIRMLRRQLEDKSDDAA